MTDYARRHEDIGYIESNKAIARVRFTPSRRLAVALGRFSVGDRPIVLRSSRRVVLDYHGTEYTPPSRQRLSRMEDSVIPIANRRIKIASHVLLRTDLTHGALGIDFKLMPSPDVRKRFGEFALDQDGNQTNYMDVHAIIPPQDRIDNTDEFDIAVDELKSLMMIGNPDLHPDSGPLPIPDGQQIHVHDSRVVSQNHTGRHLH